MDDIPDRLIIDRHLRGSATVVGAIGLAVDVATHADPEGAADAALGANTATATPTTAATAPKHTRNAGWRY